MMPVTGNKMLRENYSTQAVYYKPALKKLINKKIKRTLVILRKLGKIMH
jgi:ATP-dependent exoDNAse (exonuclease V) beta subunit